MEVFTEAMPILEAMAVEGVSIAWIELAVVAFGRLAEELNHVILAEDGQCVLFNIGLGVTYDIITGKILLLQFPSWSPLSIRGALAILGRSSTSTSYERHWRNIGMSVSPSFHRY